MYATAPPSWFILLNGSKSAPVPPPPSYLLLEDGTPLLLEDGEEILFENPFM